VNKINIALDGYSSCGKSTLAKSMANALGYVYIDTGAMYRAVTLYCIKHDVINSLGEFEPKHVIKSLPRIQVAFEFNTKSNQSEVTLNGENVDGKVRTLEVANSVSKISVIKEVRDKLTELQQKMTLDKGVVMDGRDIGTVVIPDAELKIFMTADKTIRAQRRYEELINRGDEISFQQVMENLIRRDEKDTSRKESPLVKANDAIVLDTTNITREEQFEIAMKMVDNVLNIHSIN